MNSSHVLISDTFNNRIKGLDLTTGTVDLVAGTYLGYKDGQALGTSAFYNPYGLAYDASSGLVYIVDTENCVVRVLDLSAGIISTFAGTGAPGYVDGPAAFAQFSYPSGAALDASHDVLYISDTNNNVIRMITISSSTVSTVAGTGGYGYLDGPASLAEFKFPTGIDLDLANQYLFIADPYNFVIRLFNFTSGNVSTIAGNGNPGYQNGPALQAQLGSSNGIAFDSSNGNLFIADTGNSAIRLFSFTSGNVSTFAGNGIRGYQNGPALQAQFAAPYAVKLDSSNGNLFVVDTGNNVIRLIEKSSGNVSTIAGNGFASFNNGPISSALFNNPNGVAFDPSNGNLFVVDKGNSMIRLIEKSSGNVSTVAGNGIQGYQDGPASSAEFTNPNGIAFDPSNGNIFVADTLSCFIRLINVTSLTVSTIAGSGFYGYQDGPASSAEFRNPNGIAFDPSNGNIFVADTFSNMIRLINMSSSTVSTISGDGLFGYLNGPALQAQFNVPYGIVLDPSNGNLFIADTGNNVIRLIEKSSGNVSTIAGNGNPAFSDGPAFSAEFNNPYGIALDPFNGNIFVADTFNNAIRLINMSSLTVSTIAGNGSVGFSNGIALQSEFNNPSGIAFDSTNGNIIVADSKNNRIALS